MTRHLAIRVLVVGCVSDRPETQLYLGLQESGFELTLICDPDEPKQSVFENAGIKTVPLRISHRFDLTAIRRIRSVLKERDIDVVYAPTGRGTSTALLASIGLPVRHVSYRGTSGHLSWFDPAARLAHLSSRIDRIVCNCGAVRNYLVGIGVSEKRLAVIYKGHNPEWYTELGQGSLDEFGIPHGAITVACVANVRPVKGVDLLVRAVALLKPDSLVHVLIIGDTPDDRLQKLALKLGVAERIHFAGFRKDATSLLAACDLSIMPSRDREGVPRAIIESLSVGVPVIATSVGGMPEIVEDGLSGMLIPPKDESAIARAIETLAGDADLRARLGAAGPVRVSGSFSLEQYLESFRLVLREVGQLSGRTDGTGSHSTQIL